MIIKCKMCGGDIEFTPGDTYGTCEFCGCVSTIPQADDENRLNRYNRANHFRRQCEFDKALAAYEKLLETDDTDAEAHWGAVISRYGIEYVEDPATKKRIPTCHRVQVASILADADYLAAVENAPDAASRDLYKQQAAEIAEIQKGILAISSNEKPYDVFICYKETDENGQRTHDSQWAQDVYYGLTEQGYKVFFSRITLEDKLGQQYEPYIFAALNSARVMVVIGSKPEYFSSIWMKNEWSRYLALMARDRKRLLIPCYRDMDPYDLPEELSVLQSQDMGKIGFMQDLIRGVKKVLDAEKMQEPRKAALQPTQPSAASAGAVAPLLRRVFMFLEDGDWKSADEYCEKVLDMDPENGEAYLGKLMAELKVKKREDLKNQPIPFDDKNHYQKILRFGNPALRKEVENYIHFIKSRNQYRYTKDLFSRAHTVKDYLEARDAFTKAADYENAQKCITACDEAVEKIRSEIYDYAVKAMKEAGNYSVKWYTACEQLSVPDLNGYRDVDVLREQASKRYDECLAAEKEAQRQKEEKARREAEATAAKKKRNTILGIIAAIIMVAVVLVVAQVIIPRNKYKEAEQLRADEKYLKAVATTRQEPYTKVGNIVTYGHYEQDNNTNNGKEAIEWIVLKYDNVSRKSLLLSRYGLDARRFDASKYQGWAKSEMRSWLNTTFLNNAFTAKEKEGIVTTKVSTPNYEGYSGGSDTQDKIWLLSRDEATTYFKNGEARKAIPTKYAVSKRAYQYSGSNSNCKLNGTGCCWWWLRSPGYSSSDASRVYGGGSINSDYVYSTNGSVRPAFWLDLDSADIY